jgi:hypothetical protein
VYDCSEVLPRAIRLGRSNSLAELSIESLLTCSRGGQVFARSERTGGRMAAGSRLYLDSIVPICTASAGLVVEEGCGSSEGGLRLSAVCATDAWSVVMRSH